ncbi:hypothetical protein, partial [Ornithinibacillus contaminans]|uniref:hypothetical protein n=1 Tax=Ornithinibacillus contaminans TaxID=694055 RepID=UPI00064E069D
MFKNILYVILMIFIILIVGSIILETFPQLNPLWEEFKGIIVNLYESSKVKYGALATVAIIVAVILAVGTNRR